MRFSACISAALFLFGFADALPATVRDSIGTAAIGTPLDIPPREWPAVTSPDGLHDAFEVFSGDVAADSNRYRIFVADRTTHKIGKPHQLFELVSSDGGSAPGIQGLRWANNESLMALVADHNGRRQVCKIDIATGDLVALTDVSDPILDFDANAATDAFALMETRAPVQSSSLTGVYAGRLVRTQTPYELIADHTLPLELGGNASSTVVAVRAAGWESPISLPPGEWPMPGQGLSVSPSGRYIVVPIEMMRSQVPTAWGIARFPPSWVYFYGLRLFDRTTGRLTWLVNETTSGENLAPITWSRDEKAVFISSRLSVGADGKPADGVAIVTVGSGLVVASASGRFDRLNGGQTLDSLRIVSLDQPRAQMIISSGNDRWFLKTVSPTSTRIRLRQDMTHAPILVSHDLLTGREVRLFDPNPHLSLKDVDVRQITWKMGNGYTAVAGIYSPAHIKPGVRLPLIIQTHGWDPAQFWYDGPSTAGFAARSLAQSGFLVAQIGQVADQARSEQQASDLMMIDSLIATLDRAGLVDIHRLGITGWSATGWTVRSALAFSRYHFGAAVLVASRDGGYMSYLLSNTSLQDETDAEMGGRPFGTGATIWTHNSPMFNLDRVTTPVRIVALGPFVLNQWEQWAAMRRLGKPVDFVWLPTANHWPTRPSERMEVQQGTVDWYRFWLQGIAVRSDNASEEYANWNILQGMQRNTKLAGTRANESP